jgi:hypothetical protein
MVVPKYSALHIYISNSFYSKKEFGQEWRRSEKEMITFFANIRGAKHDFQCGLGFLGPIAPIDVVGSIHLANFVCVLLVFLIAILLYLDLGNFEEVNSPVSEDYAKKSL